MISNQYSNNLINNLIKKANGYVTTLKRSFNEVELSNLGVLMDENKVTGQYQPPYYSSQDECTTLSYLMKFDEILTTYEYQALDIIKFNDTVKYLNFNYFNGNDLRLAKIIIFYWYVRLSNTNKLLDYDELNYFFQTSCNAFDFTKIKYNEERLSDNNINLITSIRQGDFSYVEEFNTLMIHHLSSVKAHHPETFKILRLIQQLLTPSALSAVTLNETLESLYAHIEAEDCLLISLDEYLQQIADTKPVLSLPIYDCTSFRYLPGLQAKIKEKKSAQQKQHVLQVKQLLNTIFKTNYPWDKNYLQQEPELQLLHQSLTKIIAHSTPTNKVFDSFSHILNQLIDEYKININQLSHDTQFFIAFPTLDFSISNFLNDPDRSISSELNTKVNHLLENETYIQLTTDLIDNSFIVSVPDNYPLLIMAQQALTLPIKHSNLEIFKEKHWCELPNLLQNHIKNHYFSLIEENFDKIDEPAFTSIWFNVPEQVLNRSSLNLIEQVKGALALRNEKLEFSTFLEMVRDNEEAINPWVYQQVDIKKKVIQLLSSYCDDTAIETSAILFYRLNLDSRNGADILDLIDSLLTHKYEKLLFLKNYLSDENKLIVDFLLGFCYDKFSISECANICHDLLPYNVERLTLSERWGTKFTKNLLDKIQIAKTSYDLRYLLEFANKLDIIPKNFPIPQLMSHKDSVFIKITTFFQHQNQPFKSVNMIAALREYWVLKEQLCSNELWLIGHQFNIDKEIKEMDNDLSLLFSCIPISQQWIKSDDHISTIFDSRAIEKLLNEFSQWDFKAHNDRFLSSQMLVCLRTWVAKTYPQIMTHQRHLLSLEGVLNQLEKGNYELNFDLDELLNNISHIYPIDFYKLFFDNQVINDALCKLDKLQKINELMISYNDLLKAQLSNEYLGIDSFDTGETEKNKDLTIKISSLIRNISSKYEQLRSYDRLDN